MGLRWKNLVSQGRAGGAVGHTAGVYLCRVEGQTDHERRQLVQGSEQLVAWTSVDWIGLVEYAIGPTEGFHW